MASNPFGERRTRSKFTLPNMDFSFQDSPLKAAKSTLKQAGKNRKKSEEASSSSQPATTEPSHTQSNSDMPTADNDDTDDELLLSPGKRIQKSHASQSGANATGSSIKRPSSRHDDYSSNLSPAEPQSPSTRRSKRARYALEALGEADKGKGKGPAHVSSEPRPNTASRHKRKRTAAASTSKKPVSSATCAYEAPTIVLGKLRANSVPLFSASFDPAIPHVDLNNPPPSPQRARSRSASKERLPKLRITSNPFPVSQPRLEPIQDENLMDVDSLPPSHSEPIRLNLEQQEISSPLTEPLSPVPLPPATSSPDLEHDDETAVEGLPAVPAMSPLSPLTPAVSSRSPSPCRLSPLPDEPQPIQESVPAPLTVNEDTPKPTVQERNGKTRLPRPTSTMNLAAKLKEVASAANAGKPSNLRVESSKGKGVAVTSKPSAPLPVNQPKPNAFDRLMAASQSANQPKAKPRPSQVASSSKVQKPKILFGSQTKPVLAEKPKVSMKSAMRKREKPKAAPKPPVLLLQPEDEEAPETAQRTPSPVVEETSEDVSNAPAAVDIVQEEPKQVPTPRLAGLFTPESTTLSLSLFGTPPPEDANDAETEITPVVDANPTPNIDVVMTSPHKDVSSPAADIAASMSPLSSIDSPMLEPDMPLAPEPVAVETIVPLDQETPTLEAVPDVVVEQAPIAVEPMVSQDQEIPTVSDIVVEQLPTTTDVEPTIPLNQEVPMPTTLPDAAVDPPPAAVEQTPPSPRKRKRGPAAQRAVPSTSRRVTRSVSQQSKPNPDAESDVQEEQQAAAPPEVGSSEAMEQSAPPEEPMVVSAPASPAKSVGGRRRSMSLKGGIASKIPVPVTPAKGGEPKSPVKPARSSPSKIARSTSLRLPRLSIHGASTLLALNDALDQLRMPPPPPPARPSTSMGFSRDLEDDDDEVPTKGKGKGKSTDDLDTARDSLRRKSTVGSSALSNKAGITKAKPTSLTQKSMNNYFAPKPDSSSKPATATRPTFQRPGGPRIFGGRVAPRASKKTTLPSVMHSPVKGGGNNGDDNDAGDDIEVSQVTARGPDVGSSSDVFIAPSPLVTREDVDEEVPVVLSAGSKRSKKLDGWRDNARRASMAFDSLNESLNNSPNVAPEASGSMGPPETPPSHRSSTSAQEANQSTSSVPDVTPPGRVTRSATAKTAPGALGKTKAGTSAHVSSKKKEVEPEVPTSLDVLDDCIVFVDVRTDEGEDAGGLFLEMLQKLGARTLTRVGSTCTHIIYKNGLNSTVSRWRKLTNKPAVVGITWVVDCAEQKKRVDETAYLIDLEGVNVAGVTKRRRSMLPKFLARELEDDSPYQDGREDDVTPNASSGSINFEDDLAPLEIIRRRTMGIVT